VLLSRLLTPVTLNTALTKSFSIDLTRRSADVPIRSKQWDNLKNCPTIFQQLIGGTHSKTPSDFVNSVLSMTRSASKILSNAIFPAMKIPRHVSGRGASME
jgi:hypothetical protein